MRRILRKIAADDFAELGDTSTLADPSVVEDLIENRQNRADVSLLCKLKTLPTSLLTKNIGKGGHFFTVAPSNSRKAKHVMM